jgi:hypothetical protein
MRQLSTYLIGSIQDADDPNASREKVEQELTELGFNVLNPCKFECNKSLSGDINEQKEKLRNLKRGGAWEKFEEIMDSIVLADEIATISSEFVIVFWDNEKKHGGTIDEICMACAHMIPIYCVNYGGVTDMNDWILAKLRRNIRQCRGQIFNNNKQLVDYVKTQYASYIKEVRDEQEKSKSDS